MTLVKRFRLSGTILRNAGWNALFITGLYILTNIFFLIILNIESARVADNHLDHELEHFMFTMHMDNDSLIIDHKRELEESDLLTVSPTSFFLQVYNLEKQILLQSKNLAQFGSIPLHFPADEQKITFSNTSVGKDNLRTIYRYLEDEEGKSSAVIQLSAFKPEFTKFIPILVRYNVYSFPFILILIVFSTILLARKSFAPINKIIDLANNISVTELNQRLDYKGEPDDELGKLRDTLNHLFDRLQNQFNQISQFTDNASHQLMSPLTVLKSELEFMQRKSHENSECRETFRIMSEQTDRMIAIIRNLLILARECNACRKNQMVLNISKLLKSIPDLFLNKNLVLNIENGLYARGNSEYFILAIQNIVDNAFKYSENGKEVALSAKRLGNDIKIDICDQGIGIPRDLREKIFERFYRIEANAAMDGFGLGLALVKEIVSAMDGTIVIEDNAPGGTCFSIKVKSLTIE